MNFTNASKVLRMNQFSFYSHSFAPFFFFFFLVFFFAFVVFLCMSVFCVSPFVSSIFVAGTPVTNSFPQRRRRNPNHVETQQHITFDQISSLTRCLADPHASEEFLKFTAQECSDYVVLFYLDMVNYEVSNLAV